MSKLIKFFLLNWTPYIKDFYYNAAKVCVVFYVLGVLTKEQLLKFNNDFSETCKNLRQKFHNQ